MAGIFADLPVFFRINLLKDRIPDATESEIRARMRSVDKARKKSCSYYTHTAFGDAAQYDLCLMSSKLGIDKCVDVICDLAQTV